MSDATDLDDRIAAAGQAPLRMTTDGVTVEGRSIDDQIKARNHSAAVVAAGKNHLGLHFVKFIPQD